MDISRLAQRMSEILGHPFISAKILDRGAYATVYQLIEPVSASASSSEGASQRPATLVRISSRPVYHDVAIGEERDKIRVYVATVNAIQGECILMICDPHIDSLGCQHRRRNR